MTYTYDLRFLSGKARFLLWRSKEAERTIAARINNKISVLYLSRLSATKSLITSTSGQHKIMQKSFTGAQVA